jgi:hypothetical protein
VGQPAKEGHESTGPIIVEVKLASFVVTVDDVAPSSGALVASDGPSPLAPGPWESFPHAATIKGAHTIPIARTNSRHFACNINIHHTLQNDVGQ